MAKNNEDVAAASRNISVARLRRENEYLAALHDTALALMNRLNVTDLLEVVISRACALIGTDYGYIYLLTNDHSYMEVRIVYGEVFAESVGRRIKCGEGLSGLVWQTGQPIALGDYSAWPSRLAPYPDYSNLHALIGVPLKSGSQVVGVLGLAHTEPDRAFSNDDLVLAGEFAELASIALDNASLYTAAQTELGERKRAEAAQRRAYEALRQSEQRYRALFEYTSDGVSIFDLNGDTVAVNQRIADMLGYQPEELVGTSILSTVSPAERRDALNKLISVLNGISLPVY
jgi:GAF domain-containing protein